MTVGIGVECIADIYTHTWTGRLWIWIWREERSNHRRCIRNALRIALYAVTGPCSAYDLPAGREGDTKIAARIAIETPTRGEVSGRGANAWRALPGSRSRTGGKCQ